MSTDAFTALAARTRLGPRAVEAARLHLIGGLTLQAAGIAAGWPAKSAAQHTWRAVQRIQQIATAEPVCPLCGNGR